MYMKKAAETKRTSEKTKKQILIKELTALLKLLDEQGLEFLKHQAGILLHNARIENVRRNTQSHASENGQSVHSEEDLISGMGIQKKTAVFRDIRIERTDHNYFNIFVGRSRIFFNRDELRSLAKICHASGGVSEGTTRLYRWFERERKDFLNDTGIERAGDPALAELFDVIVHNYKVKDH
jgi:hypothetical protein